MTGRLGVHVSSTVRAQLQQDLQWDRRDQTEVGLIQALIAEFVIDDPITFLRAKGLAILKFCAATVAHCVVELRFWLLRCLRRRLGSGIDTLGYLQAKSRGHRIENHGVVHGEVESS